nr:MBL fold metallo-hydrolase [uncultured Flavobacterium sp.]
MILHTIGTGSSGNSYLLKPEKGQSLIIDCGVNFKKVKETVDFDINSICGAVQSHSHGDHSKFTKDFIKSGINVYMSSQNQKEIGLKSHRIMMIENNKQFQVGDFKIMPFEVNHDVYCFGFLIHHPECGTTLYLTDTSYSNYVFKGLNNLIIECNYSDQIIENKLNGNEFLRDRIIGSHMSLETLLELLGKNDLSKVNNIVLIHLSDSNSNAIDFKNAVRKATNCNVIVSDANQTIDFDKTPF